MPGHRNMGSTPSSPNRDISEKFWVPPAVLERKRAQSLVPTMSHRDSDDDPFSGRTTPGSAGLREISFNFSTEKMDGLPPLTLKSRPRRASMQDAIDLKTIDTKLYDRRLQRQRSLCSSTEEDNTLGSLNLILQYNAETHLLAVEIVQASDLVPPSTTTSANPYCKVTLLPDRPSQLRTKVQYKTLDPLFQEEFIFDVTPQKLTSSELQVLLYDSDQDVCLGEVRLPLDSVDFSDPCSLEIWKKITHYEEKETKQKLIGEIMFSLGYLSSAERLTVVVIKARNLRHTDQSKMLDPFVKVAVIQNNKRIKKKKTSTSHGTENPTYNEALVFSISRDILRNISLEIQVCHENKLGNDDVLGRVKLGLDTVGEEKVHWNDVVSCKATVARWHMLC